MRQMATSTQLIDDLRATHAELEARLRAAREVDTAPGQSRRGCPPIDLYCSRQARHLHAVDAVLVPMVRRAPDTGPLCHAYVQATRELEVVVAHVKAHEYGSAYESSFDWDAVWDDVAAAAAEQWRLEQEVGERLAETASAEELERASRELARHEQHGPTRPHPYLPHTGVAGGVSRGVMTAADAFWDAVEGRHVPQPRRPERRRPGLLGQYVLGDPRFDEDQAER